MRKKLPILLDCTGQGKRFAPSFSYLRPTNKHLRWCLKILHLCALVYPCVSFAAVQTPTMAKHAMISSAQHLATQAGIAILKQGGNAIDAAVAVGYALAVVEPCCGNIGGGGFMLIRLADGKTTVINFRETAPAAIKTALFLDKQGKPIPHAMTDSYLAVGIPGTVAGFSYALQHYGTLPLAQIMQPAIALASQGYQLEQGDLNDLTGAVARFNTQANVAAIFTKQGKPYQPGDTLVQQNLANTLKRIATQGNAGFYEGKTAKAIVDASQAHGGVISLQDLKNYRVETLKPITCYYRGYQIISAPPPSSGGVTLCEILAITEAFPLQKLGYRTPESSHDIIEAMRYAYMDRNQYLGDPDFVHNPIDILLSPAHISAIVKTIKTQTQIDAPASLLSTTEGNNTTHYSIIDKAGNAVSVTYTLNNDFGSGLIAGNTGFFLNNEMDDFTLLPHVANEYQLKQGDANRIQPGKRPLSSMSPTIVLKDNQLFLVLGTPGGSTIITQVLEAIENILDYHMNIKTAIDAPRYHMQGEPNIVFIEPDAFSHTTQMSLVNRGYHFQLGPPFSSPDNSLTWGAMAIVEQDPKTHVRYGAIDKRRPAGLAEGY